MDEKRSRLNRPRGVGKTQPPEAGQATGPNAPKSPGPRRSPSVRHTPKTHGPNTLPAVDPEPLTQDGVLMRRRVPTQRSSPTDSILPADPKPSPPSDSTSPPRPRGKSGSTIRRPGSRPSVRSGSGLGNFALQAAQGEKYRLLDELGRGGIGVVQAAEDMSLRRDLALKFLHDPDNQFVQAKFIEEAQITGQLQHPNIVPIYELGVDKQGRPYMAMKRIHGRTLRAMIADAHRRGRVSEVASIREERRLLDVFLKVCDAIAFAHSHGIIHRDLKPENVMVGDFGEVLVVDWGLAKPIGADDDDDDDERARAHARSVMSDRRAAGGPVSMDGVIVGTIPYMPPEQAAGMSSQLDEGADIYALGAVLYTILTDTVPFQGDPDDDVEVLAAVIEGALELPSERAPQARVPRELEAVVVKAMARRRGNRYATVLDLKADIESYLEGKTLAAADYTPWQLLVKWALRNKVAVAGAAAVFVTMLVSVGVIVAIVQQGEFQRQAASYEREKIARDAKEAEWRLLAQSGELDALKTQLGVELKFTRDRAADEFRAMYDEARKLGKSQEQFFRELTERDVRRYIRAFEAVLEASEQYRQTYYTVEDLNLLGVLYSGGLREFERAHEFYSRAIQFAPTFQKAYNNRGILAIQMDKPGDGVADLTRAIQLDPTDGGAYGNRGAAYLHMDERDKALSDFTKAIELAGDDAMHWLNRGTLYRIRGSNPEAIRDFTEAIRLEPNNARAYFERGLIHKVRGDLSSALDDFDQAISLEGTDDVAANAAEIYFERADLRAGQRDFAGAVADLSVAISRKPDFARAIYTRAAVWGELEQVEAAVRDLQKVYELRPTYRPRLKEQLAAGHAELASESHRNGHLEKALDHYSAAIRLIPDEAALYDQRGICRAQSRDFTGAEQDFNHAIRLAPNEHSPWHNLAVLNLQRGRLSEAHRALTEALRRCNDPEKRHELSTLLRQLEDEMRRQG